MQQAILLAVVAHIFWTVGNLLNVLLSRRITAFQTVLFQTIFVAIFLTPITIFQPLNVNIGAIIFASILSLVLYSGTLLFYTALSKGSSQISGAITATGPAITAVLSIVFLHTKISGLALVLIAIITAGLVIVSWPKKHASFDLGVSYAIAALVLWSVYFTFISKSIDALGPYWANYIAVVSGVIFLLLYRSVKHPGQSGRVDRQHLPLVAASAVFVGGAPLAYSLALTKSTPAIISPIAGSYAALFIVLSSIIFKDKVSKRQWIGIVITVVAVLAFTVVINR